VDQADHLLAPVPVRAARWPESGPPHPFVRFREWLFVHRAAFSLGFGDERYLRIVEDLDAAVEAVDGRGLRETPYLRAPGIERALGLDSGAGSEVWIKDETGNVSGSHKARHLFGIALYLKLLSAAGIAPKEPLRLAIASCGNAALAAAVVARAAGFPLDVFVPDDAHPRVLSRLHDLGAAMHVCARSPGELGDPCVRAFRAAVSAGAVPFACQGTENGLTLDGGLTLGFELADAFRRGPLPDRLFVQIGGGALGSSVWRALDLAVQTGLLARPPRLMTVQTERVAPLAAAHERAVTAILARSPDIARPAANRGDALADALRAPAASAAVQAVLADVAAHRARYLEVWPSPAPSLAHGILDDDTYDGAALLKGMLATGGSPVLVSESALQEAEDLCRRETGIDADATGAAALAGLLQWNRQRNRPRGAAAEAPPPERVALLVTGHRR
jgi:threonine synthase